MYVYFYIYFSVNDGCGWWADVSQSALRKVKSAEHIGIPPTIIVNRLVFQFH